MILDIVGSINNISKRKTEGKAYIAVFARSLKKLSQDSVVNTSIPMLKRFIARRGRPRVIYSDNAQSCKVAANWIKSVMKYGRLNEFLTDLSISWRFDIGKAPQWVETFERIIKLTKNAMYKGLERANLSLMS